MSIFKMRHILSFMIFVIVPVGGFSDIGDHHLDGLNHGEVLHGEMKNYIGGFSPHDVPGFEAAIPPEAMLNDKNINAEVSSRLSNDESAIFVQNSTINGKEFIIDPTTDPAFVGMDETANDPLKVISENAQETETPSEKILYETKYCDESDEDEKHVCYKTLKVDIVITTPRQEIKRWYCHGHQQKKKNYKHKWTYHRDNNANCNRRGYYRSIIIPEKYKEVDSWSSDCTRLEDMVDRGGCNYESKVCTEPNETRIISGKSVTRACWKEKYTYTREYVSKNNCHELRARGCFQEASQCIKYVGGRCVERRQEYLCPVKILHANRSRISGSDTPFCLDGNCKSQSYEPNNEMLDAISKLYIFQELQNQKTIDDVSIFKGDQKKCSRYCMSFKDCCKKGKGWGVDAGLAQCNAVEKELRVLREKNLCHQVGTYCHKKVAGQCVQKRTSFCCFPSKIARILQVQGRPQIGLSWGSPKKPLCRGFTVDELTKIDFNKLDLSEIFQEILEKFKEKKPNIDSGKIIQNVESRIKNQLETVKKGGL
ncbi:MAG: conjugal transfer protein TraN [Alphaproteobacteria bacterium]|nr:conjugal transfer protein TraN [Alphaproteobacteria bacterium]MDP3532602.1 conjugal transfer protein TraN [Alphaproteobacteria bacterium]